MAVMGIAIANVRVLLPWFGLIVVGLLDDGGEDDPGFVPGLGHESEVRFAPEVVNSCVFCPQFPSLITSYQQRWAGSIEYERRLTHR